jgi:hypothetical protein
LDRHENLAIRLVDGPQHHGLEVIALAPTSRQGATVLPITVVVEANLNARWEGEGWAGIPFTDRWCGSAAKAS